MAIVLGMSKQKDFHRPKKPLKKTREIDNEAIISKEAEMKRKFNRNQKRITPRDIQLSSLIFLVKLNNFCVPQDSILGPVLFNLYIVDLVENVTCDSLQYTDDSTLYKHLKLKNLKKCIEELESDLETVSLWSSNNSSFQ